MLFSIIYNISLLVLAFLAAPKVIYQYFFQNKYKKSLSARFGQGFPRIEKKGKRLVWIHAVSVGETKAVAALAKLIKEEADHPIVLVSSVTETGHAEAIRSIPFADYHVYLPLDLSGVIAPIVRRTQPDLVIITETDLWYHFLKQAKEVGAEIVVVNGKISIRSYNRLKKFDFFTKRLYSLVDRWIVQNRPYKERFENLGVSADKIFVTANLKFDQEYEKLSDDEVVEWKKKLGLRAGDQVLVVGSTHHPEEKIVLDALRSVWKGHPNLKVLFVPRHPERFDAVASLLDQAEVKYKRLSRPSEDDVQVVLVDSMGVLRKGLQIADAALIGGSFAANIGGHNILEPCAYGVPVLFGPYMQSQPDLARLVLDHKAGMQVSEENLIPALDSLLSDSELRKSMGEAGLDLVKNIRGSTQETWKLLHFS